MHIAFLNPQGNFDPQDRYWTEHPDFGGQLVYVKELSLALGELGHRVDILTRRIKDPDWHGFESRQAAYPDAANVRILRFACGGEQFLRKEDLWPTLGAEWVPAIQRFYRAEGESPDVATAHYGDGGIAASLWQDAGGPPFTFTGHSLGAQKLDRLLAAGQGSLSELNQHYHFATRIAAERVSMNHASRVITSTSQERFEQYGHAAYGEAIHPEEDQRFALVPPGVNLRIFDAEANGSEDDRIPEYLEGIFRRDLHSERQRLTPVIASSRLDPKKNVTGLVEAFGRSQQLQQAANLLLVVRGAEDIRSRRNLNQQEGRILDEILELVERYQLQGKLSVFSLNSQAELAAAYRFLSKRDGVFCLTAFQEPFGLAPLEAMAAGLPVAVTKNGGPSESLIESGQEYGVLIDPEDPLDIARGLLRLVTVKAEWERMHTAGRGRVLNRYTWKQTAEGYLSVLNTLKPRTGSLPIPAYFTAPALESEIPMSDLKRFWKEGG